MPNPYIDNIQRWRDLSEIDFLGYFVKTWLAFNAWYRSVYTHRQERKIIDEIKWQPNSVRNKIVPLLRSDAEEGDRFRSHIGALHHRLENFHLHTGNGTEKNRITLTAVYLKDNVVSTQSGSRNGVQYQCKANSNQKQFVSMVTNKNGTAILTISQSIYNLVELETHVDFVSNLTVKQQGYLRAMYQNMNPRLIVDLTNRGTSAISTGPYKFTCAPDELFAGICEVIYLMRCHLFHGELVPSRDAIACYEPAYHIVQTFLLSIS